MNLSTIALFITVYTTLPAEFGSSAPILKSVSVVVYPLALNVSTCLVIIYSPLEICFIPPANKTFTLTYVISIEGLVNPLIVNVALMGKDVILYHQFCFMGDISFVMVEVMIDGEYIVSNLPSSEML